MAPEKGARRLDDPNLIHEEYGRPERLAARMRVIRKETDGENPEHAVRDAVIDGAPHTVLEVGCGDGTLAAELSRYVPSIVAVDLSPAMVVLARARGVDAQVSDVHDLPFPSGSFDCVVAAWMLYHASDLDVAIAETKRVLKPTGRLVAATISLRNMEELWDVLRFPTGTPVTFRAENGCELLAPHFESVIERKTEGRVAFASREEVRDYVASTIRRAHLVDRIPAELGPVEAVSRHSVFTCDGPR